jgi:general secretion pathway protein D
VQYASAESVSKAIGQLFTVHRAERGAPELVKVVPFERTNALIVFAPKAHAAVRDLVAKLDVEMPRGEGNIRVSTSSMPMPRRWSRC